MFVYNPNESKNMITNLSQKSKTNYIYLTAIAVLLCTDSFVML